MDKEMRLIDADKAKFFIADVLDIFEVPVGDRMANRLLEVIDALPTVDAVPVVRCKKCLYRSQYADENGLYKCGAFETKDGLVFKFEPDFFCAYGERRTDHV